MSQIELDALSLEYKRDYGTAVRNVDVSNILDNSIIQSVTSVFGLSLPKEALDLLRCDVSIGDDNSPYSMLVSLF